MSETVEYRDIKKLPDCDGICLYDDWVWDYSTRTDDTYFALRHSTYITDTHNINIELLPKDAVYSLCPCPVYKGRSYHNRVKQFDNFTELLGYIESNLGNIIIYDIYTNYLSQSGNIVYVIRCDLISNPV